MSGFCAAVQTFTGALEVEGPVGEVFALFSPQGERQWVPGWDPEFVHPSVSFWGAGQVFRTREESGEAVWVIAALEDDEHQVEYYRVEPARYVAHITVRCRETAAGRTRVTTSYSFTGLSEAGNRIIAAMTPAEYEAKMARWQGWIERLRRGGGERSERDRE